MTMKLGFLAATALVSSTIISTPAFADTVTPPTADAADGVTLAAMQSQCDALAAVHGPATGDNDHFTGEVVEGAVTLISGPTETGNRVVDEDSITPTGTYVPAALEIRGNPYKSGGSVNMFGDQWSTAGYYPDSTYNFTADFGSTFAHAFSCDISQEVYHAPVHHDAVVHPAVPPEGYYTNNGTNPSGQEGSCQGRRICGIGRRRSNRVGKSRSRDDRGRQKRRHCEISEFHFIAPCVALDRQSLREPRLTDSSALILC
jgi:hypothetical protein